MCNYFLSPCFHQATSPARRPQSPRRVSTFHVQRVLLKWKHGNTHFFPSLRALPQCSFSSPQHWHTAECNLPLMCPSNMLPTFSPCRSPLSYLFPCMFFHYYPSPSSHPARLRPDSVWTCERPAHSERCQPGGATHTVSVMCHRGLAHFTGWCPQKSALRLCACVCVRESESETERKN